MAEDTGNGLLPDSTMEAEVVRTMCIAWKKRTGLGALMTSDPWVQRRIALIGSKIYYYDKQGDLGDEDDEGTKRAYAYRTPRGVLDVVGASITQLEASDDLPTPFCVCVDNEKVVWEFCFETRDIMEEWLALLQQVYDRDNVNGFEHIFEPGDHIYRWEMIVFPPVIYPIQIHGIVLEAGKNCVILADFGLTGYRRKEGSWFGHSGGQQEEETHLHDSVVAAFNKLRPSGDQRLTIVTMTQQEEFRKWTKVNYGKNSFLPQKGTLGKLTSSLFGGSKTDDAPKQVRQSVRKSDLTNDDDVPDWLKENDAPAEETRKEPELPKSDPKKIVLARAQFLLERGDEVLPPYHVFYSNSECIAVWCKTGRWSTLQTAVFLTSTTVGSAKSATLTVMGVAAAHALLAPVVAVGGLLWATAPMYILQKSRESWEKSTMKLTELFWAQAGHEVFVEAIKHWSGLQIDNGDPS